MPKTKLQQRNGEFTDGLAHGAGWGIGTGLVAGVAAMLYAKRRSRILEEISESNPVKRANFSPGAALGHAANLGVALSSGFAIVDRYQRINDRRQGRKMKRSKRNPPFTLDVNIPDDIIDRLGNEHINDIFNTEYPAETLRALIAQALVEDDYHGAADYQRLLVIIENAEGREVNPSRAYVEMLSRKVTEAQRRYAETGRKADRKRAEDYYNELQRVISENPAYTVNLEMPSVRESVEVKGPFLTTGGALRQGKRKLRHAAKAHPKWSVERNARRNPAIIYNQGEARQWAQDMANLDGKPYFILHFNENEYMVADSGELDENSEVVYPAETMEGNPRNRKRLRMATLLNPSGLAGVNSRLAKLVRARSVLEARLRAGDTRARTQLERVNKQIEREMLRQTKRNGKVSSAVKSRLNSAARMFHGAFNPHAGKERNVPISDFARGEHYTRLGGLPWIRPVDQYGVVRPNSHKCPNSTDHACERCAIRFNPRTSYLGMTANRRIQLMGRGVAAEARKLRAQLERANPELKGQTIDLGPSWVTWYVTEEKHSNSMRPIHYYHEHAEDSRNPADRPHLMLSAEPMFYLSGGNYTVTERGIEN